MVRHNRYAIFAALFAGVIFASSTTHMTAAELRFNASAYVNGVSTFNGKHANSYQLIGGTFGRDLSKITVRGTSLANATTSLNYTATPENYKEFELKSNANPEKHASSATAQIHTAPRRDKSFDDVKVTVAPSFREKPGQKVRVTVTVFCQSLIWKKDNSTYNHCKVYVNGEKKVDKKLTTTVMNVSHTFHVDTVIGKSFTIRLSGVSHAKKSNRAAQTLRVTMRVK